MHSFKHLSFVCCHSAVLLRVVVTFAALVKADDVEKTLHLNIAFGRITSSQFWDAIEGALAPAMKHRKAEADLQLFANTFDGVKFRKGAPLSMITDTFGLH